MKHLPEDLAFSRTRHKNVIQMCGDHNKCKFTQDLSGLSTFFVDLLLGFNGDSSSFSLTQVPEQQQTI